MKTLILAACVGSTVAVVAPQFPPPAVSFADAGMGTEVRPFSMYGEATQGVGPSGGSSFATCVVHLGSVPAEFVVTEFSVVNGGMPIWDAVLRASGTKIAACNAATSQFSVFSASAKYQHGIPIHSGSVVEVEVQVGQPPSSSAPLRVTVSGYLR